jgi:hypothetical protein
VRRAISQARRSFSEFSEPAVPVSEAAGTGTGLTVERREPVGVVVVKLIAA